MNKPRKLTQVAGVGFSAGPRFGVELELEEIERRPVEPGYYKVVGDGSLRGNSLEVVSNVLNENTLPRFVEEVTRDFGEELDRYQSYRTSMHIHYNVGHMTPEELYFVVLGNFFMDAFITELISPDRKGNNFARPLYTDIEKFSLMCLKCHEIGVKRSLAYYYKPQQRYYSINLASIFHQSHPGERKAKGTIEYRMFQLPHLTSEIHTLVKCLHKLNKKFMSKAELSVGDFIFWIHNSHEQILETSFKPFKGNYQFIDTRVLYNQIKELTFILHSGFPSHLLEESKMTFLGMREGDLLYEAGLNENLMEAVRLNFADNPALVRVRPGAMHRLDDIDEEDEEPYEEPDWAAEEA